MIAKMDKYSFILFKEETEGFLDKLQEFGLIDISRSSKAIDDRSALMMAKADELKKRISWLEKGDYTRDEEYASILAQLAEWNAVREERSHWGTFDKSLIETLAKAGRKIRFYCVAKKKFDANWAQEYPLEVIEDNGEKVWFVTVSDSRDYAFPIAECAAPKDDVAQAEAEITSLKGKLEARAAELDKEKDGIGALKSSYQSDLAELDLYLANAATETAAEDKLTVFTGFAPCENKDELTGKFDEMDVFYFVDDSVLEDNPPIKLKNNKFVKMFEVLTDMYGRPAYNGFDPTPYISIFFLLFFAMCVGDAGYGLVLVIVGLLLKKVKSFANLAPLVVTLGVGTFVVGFLFHTFFSVDISSWNCIPDFLKKCMVPAKVSTYDGTMVLALIIGVIHLCLAMIVKTVYATKNNGFLESLSTWGWTIFLVGCAAVGACALAGVIDSAVTKTVIIIIGIVSALGIFLFNNIHRNPLVNIGSGLWETYNTATGVLGDVLSYLRLYALGLAGSMLGFAFNDLAKMALGDGGFGWIPFVLIVIIGHTLNLAMAALGAFVHPLRLNFLEFFKNSGYEGVGRVYKPLKKNN